MIRTKKRITLTITSGSALSSSDTFGIASWMTIEVPEADKAKAITVQTRSPVTGDWRDVVTIADVTNAFKQLTATEMSVIGPLEEIRLKFASNVAATGIVVLHTSS